MDGYVDGTDGWMHGCMDGCMDAWMHGCMDAWMDGWNRLYLNTAFYQMKIYIIISFSL